METKVTFRNLARVPMFVFGLFSQVLVYGAIAFLSPTLSLHLTEYDGFDEFWVGMYFAVPSVIYVLNTPAVTFYCRVMSRRTVVFIGMFIFCISIFMIGTSPLLQMTDNSKFIFFGLVFLGFSAGMVVIPVFPEMLASIEARFPEMSVEDLNNVAAGYFNSCLGIGEATGPIFASVMTAEIGFRHAEDILGVLVILYLVFYFILLGNLKLFKCGCEEESENVDDQFIDANDNLLKSSKEQITDYIAEDFIRSRLSASGVVVPAEKVSLSSLHSQENRRSSLSLPV